MDYIKELINVGDDVLYTVTSAIEENDFSGLSAELKERFRIFEEDVRQDIQNRTGKTVPGNRPGSRGAGGRAPRRVTREVPSDGAAKAPGVRRKAPPGLGSRPPGYANQKNRTPFRARFYKKGSAVAKIVCGIIGMIGFVPALLGSFATMMLGYTGGVIAFFTLAPFTAASVWLTVTGDRKMKLVDVYNRYAELIGPAEYITVEELAVRAGTSEDDVVRKLRKLMKKNMLPQGRFDRNLTTLMLTPRVWNQYLELENFRKNLKKHLMLLRS